MVRVPLPDPLSVLLVASDGEAFAFLPVTREYLADCDAYLVECLDDAIEKLHDDADLEERERKAYEAGEESVPTVPPRVAAWRVE